MTLEDKHQLILANEQLLAGRVAAEVVDRPQLSLWMILIPIFFVFYYFQYRRYKNGLKDFKKYFLATRRRALDAAYHAIIEEKSVDLVELAKVEDLSSQLYPLYQDWIGVLVDHFELLLRADGSSFAELVRSSHRNKSTYLIFLSKLKQVEHNFYEGIMHHQHEDQIEFRMVIQQMERSSHGLRRDQADQVFHA